MAFKAFFIFGYVFMVFGIQLYRRPMKTKIITIGASEDDKK
jgi:hypothetical protein